MEKNYDRKGYYSGSNCFFMAARVIMQLEQLVYLMLALQAVVAAAAAGTTASSTDDYKRPSNVTFYLHNKILDPVRYNNTDDFNSVFTVQPTGLPSNPWNFGIVATFEDPLTATPSAADNDTQLQREAIGVGRGFYMYDSQASFVTLYAFTATFNATNSSSRDAAASFPYVGSVQIFGQMQESLTTRLLSVIGGTGDFFLARGLASCQLVQLNTTGGPTRWTISFQLDLYY